MILWRARPCLWLWAALTLLVAPQAQASPFPHDLRLAVVLSGPMKLIVQVQQELTLPLSAEADIIQTSAYRKAAASIGIVRHPRSNRAAPHVGRALGAQFVLLIDALEVLGADAPQDFVGVRLIECATSAVLHEQRYFLPGGALTPSVAAAMLQRIVPLMRGWRPEGQPSFPSPQPTPERRPAALAPAALPRPPGAPARPQPPGQAPQHPMGAAGGANRRAAQKAAGGQAARVPSRPWALTVGPRLAWRRARLLPMLPTTGQRQAVPYGAGRGLGQPLLGGAAQLSMRWRRLGFDGSFEWLGGKHSTQVGGLPETGRAMEMHVAASFAVQLLSHAEACVAPRVGTRHDRLPIDIGPFVGLSYTAATAGLQLATPKFRDRLQLHGTVDGVFLAGLGLEAARAGRPHLAQGVRVVVQPRVLMGPWHATLHLAIDHRAGHFTGATALFSHARYQAMALSDTHVSMGIDFGGSF